MLGVRQGGSCTLYCCVVVVVHGCEWWCIVWVGTVRGRDERLEVGG